MQYNSTINANIGDGIVVDIGERYREQARRLALASQDKSDCERILGAALNGVTRSEVARLVRRPARELDVLLGQLMTDGAIKAVVTHGKRGRPLTMFLAKGKKGEGRGTNRGSNPLGTGSEGK